MTNRVCIYVCSSAEDLNPDHALTEQIQGCARWCNRHRAPAVLMFVDAPVSGGNGGRPSLKQMLAMAAKPNPPFNLILAHSASRLFRDSAAFERCQAELARVGVCIDFVVEPLDSPGRSTFAKSMPRRSRGKRQ